MQTAAEFFGIVFEDLAVLEKWSHTEIKNAASKMPCTISRNQAIDDPAVLGKYINANASTVALDCIVVSDCTVFDQAVMSDANPAAQTK